MEMVVAYLELLTQYLFQANEEKLQNIITRRGDYRRGFGLEIVFIHHFNMQLVTTSNYNAIADLHTLQVTSAQTSVLNLLQSPLVVSL
jgi:hypothetical protein